MRRERSGERRKAPRDVRCWREIETGRGEEKGEATNKVEKAHSNVDNGGQGGGDRAKFGNSGAWEGRRRRQEEEGVGEKRRGRKSTMRERGMARVTNSGP